MSVFPELPIEKLGSGHEAGEIINYLARGQLSFLYHVRSHSLRNVRRKNFLCLLFSWVLCDSFCLEDACLQSGTDRNSLSEDSAGAEGLCLGERNTARDVSLRRHTCCHEPQSVNLALDDSDFYFSKSTLHDPCPSFRQSHIYTPATQCWTHKHVKNVIINSENASIILTPI